MLPSSSSSLLPSPLLVRLPRDPWASTRCCFWGSCTADGVQPLPIDGPRCVGEGFAGVTTPWSLHHDHAMGIPRRILLPSILSKELPVLQQLVPPGLPMAQPAMEKAPSVYLYIPNIIGYFRIILNFIAFAVCYTNRPLFAILYFFSFFCDGLDGWFARKFNQASTFGAVLDMVTHRVSTACLLALLSQFYRPGLVFLILLGLDITSHWFQMYS